MQGVFYDFHNFVQHIQDKDLQGLVFLCIMHNWVWWSGGWLSQALGGSVRLAGVGVGSCVGSGRFGACGGSGRLTGASWAGVTLMRVRVRGWVRVRVCVWGRSWLSGRGSGSGWGRGVWVGCLVGVSGGVVLGGLWQGSQGLADRG